VKNAAAVALVGGEKLAELEQALKIERVSVSVAKGGAA
jgi:hypothetical protein